LIHYYTALRAYDRFLEIYSSPPGSTENFTSDTALMISLVTDILGEPPANPEMVEKACAEM
jgi:hypothetical protein